MAIAYPKLVNSNHTICLLLEHAYYVKIDVLVMKCLATQITGTEITGQKSTDQDRYILLYKHLISNTELLQKEIVISRNYRKGEPGLRFGFSRKRGRLFHDIVNNYSPLATDTEVNSCFSIYCT